MYIVCNGSYANGICSLSSNDVTLSLLAAAIFSSLITFANSLDQDQQLQHFGPDPDPNCLKLNWRCVLLLILLYNKTDVVFASNSVVQ